MDNHYILFNYTASSDSHKQEDTLSSLKYIISLTNFYTHQQHNVFAKCLFSNHLAAKTLTYTLYQLPKYHSQHPRVK